MIFKFKNGEKVEGVTLVHSRLFNIIKTNENDYLLVNINQLDNNIEKDDTNDNERTKPNIDTK